MYLFWSTYLRTRLTFCVGLQTNWWNLIEYYYTYVGEILKVISKKISNLHHGDTHSTMPNNEPRWPLVGNKSSISKHLRTASSKCFHKLTLLYFIIANWYLLGRIYIFNLSRYPVAITVIFHVYLKYSGYE